MKAIVAEGAGRIRVIDVDPPVPYGDEVVVDVHAVSVNRGDLHRLREATPGWRPGWDFAGAVVTAPASSGFTSGERVYGIAAAGGWAERVSVPANRLASLPHDLPYEVAAAIPVAGLTAQRILRLAGNLTGRTVLVTGAASGVGRFAVQLASHTGGDVTAVVRDASRAAGLDELGARDVITVISSLLGEYDIILESVGGASLGHALNHVRRNGIVVSFGNSARNSTIFSVSEFYVKQATLRGYYLLDDIETDPPGHDLATLARLVSHGSLRVDVDMVVDINAAPAVLRELAERRIAGKAVVRIRSDSGRPPELIR